jgi:AraC family transcriptional regulator
MTMIRRDMVEAKDIELFHCDLLAALIIEANTYFETDRHKAKRCIERAAELVCNNQPGDPVELFPTTVRGGLTGGQMRRVSAYIESNIGARIPSTTLAALVRLSNGHFFRSFRASFGTSPQTFIMRQRIRRAEMLMANSTEPLARIALDCGLSDQAHFSRSFRRVVGVSPNVWRRQINGGPVDDGHPSARPPQISRAQTSERHSISGRQQGSTSSPMGLTRGESVSPAARWMTGTVLRMDGGEVKSV